MTTRRECLRAFCDSYTLDDRYIVTSDVDLFKCFEGPMTITIPECPICGREHKNITCTPVKNPMKGWTHEVPCPNSPEDIILFSFEHQQDA